MPLPVLGTRRASRCKKLQDTRDGLCRTLQVSTKPVSETALATLRAGKATWRDVSESSTTESCKIEGHETILRVLQTKSGNVLKGCDEGANLHAAQLKSWACRQNVTVKGQSWVGFRTERRVYDLLQLGVELRPPSDNGLCGFQKRKHSSLSKSLVEFRACGTINTSQYDAHTHTLQDKAACAATGFFER